MKKASETRCRTCGGDGIEPNGSKACSTCGGSGGAPLPRPRADFAELEVALLAHAPRATTDQDGQKIEVLILSERMSSTGLVKVRQVDSQTVDRTAGPTIVRHRDRLSPINDAARALLGKS